MPSIIFLVGTSGSGKTTLRTTLFFDMLSDLPMLPVTSVTVSRDDILEQWAERSGVSHQEAFSEHAEAAAEAMTEQLKQALSNNQFILVDQTNLTAEQRAERMAYVPDHYKKIAITLEAPYQTLVERIEERRKKTGKDIPSFVLEKQVESYERPTHDEGFDEIYIISSDDPAPRRLAMEGLSPGI